METDVRRSRTSPKGRKQAMKRPDLPVFYYHDHFVEMLSFVQTTYGPILSGEHDAFVLRFQSLSKDAQCLLIRMINRRGAIFNRAFFRYAEIADVERAAEDLMACGQARRLNKGADLALPDLLGITAFAFIAMALLTVGFKSKPVSEQAQNPPLVGQLMQQK
jgi:hypothetical protein